MSILKLDLRLIALFLSCALICTNVLARNNSEPVKYKSMSISSPQNDATVRLSEGPVSISVRLSPELQTGFKHQIRILLNGKQVAKGQQSSFQLDEVYRGTHTVTAQAVDQRGAVLIRAKPVTIHVHQHSRLFKSAN